MTPDSTSHNFTEVRLSTPYDNLAAALSIIQTHILASDTTLKREALFGPTFDYTETVALQAAVSLLVPLIGPIDHKETWED